MESDPTAIAKAAEIRQPVWKNSRSIKIRNFIKVKNETKNWNLPKLSLLLYEIFWCFNLNYYYLAKGGSWNGTTHVNVCGSFRQQRGNGTINRQSLSGTVVVSGTPFIRKTTELLTINYMLTTSILLLPDPDSVSLSPTNSHVWRRSLLRDSHRKPNKY